MNWRFPLALATVFLFVVKMVGVTIRAFSTPWTGTSDQMLFVFFLLCVSVVLVTLAVVWRRHGYAELQRRFSAAPETYRTGKRPQKTRFESLAIWIVVALILVFLFQFMQHRPAAQTTRSALPSSAMR